MKKILVANWKMNPATSAAAHRLMSRTIAASTSARQLEIIACPPTVYISEIATIRAADPASRRVALGAQDISWHNATGSYTGEVSGQMLRQYGVTHCIVGHSERRGQLQETDEMVSQKITAALSCGMSVIACVGESAGIRRNGIAAAKKFIKTQLEKSIPALLSLPSKNQKPLMVAYEPIWAIGTGNAETPESAGVVITYIKELLASRHNIANPIVLYGGSVNDKNIASFLHQDEIDGALVGGASVDAAGWSSLVKKASLVS